MNGFYSYHYDVMGKALVCTYTGSDQQSQKPKTVAKNVRSRDESIIKAKEHFNKVARLFEIKGKSIPEVFYP